jgi:hypothetical protein
MLSRSYDASPVRRHWRERRDCTIGKEPAPLGQRRLRQRSLGLAPLPSRHLRACGLHAVQILDRRAKRIRDELPADAAQFSLCLAPGAELRSARAAKLFHNASLCNEQAER